MTGIAAAGAAELDAALNRFVTKDGLPGAAAGVVHGDELAWAAGAGFADMGAQVTSDPGTLYRIASITKTFTVIFRRHDDGRVISVLLVQGTYLRLDHGGAAGRHSVSGTEISVRSSTSSTALA